MLLSIGAVILGLILLVWSADRFIDGAAATSKHMGMPSLLIGMLIVGFGTSAPELVVSLFAAMDGNPGLALGNAFGSNIANTGLIIGVTTLIAPIMVHSSVLKKELPILLTVTVIVGFLLMDGHLTRVDGLLLLGILALFLGWSIFSASKKRNAADALATEMEAELDDLMPLKKAVLLTIVGLVVLVGSSRLLVWGAVNIAHELGVSDLVVGLTVVAIGTSLPELASSIIAARKGEHDIALGNVVGSNMFNLLGVIGIAVTVHPLEVERIVLHRDWSVVMLLSIALLVMGVNLKRQGRINRWEGSLLLLSYVVYTAWLVIITVQKAQI